MGKITFHIGTNRGLEEDVLQRGLLICLFYLGELRTKLWLYHTQVY